MSTATLNNLLEYLYGTLTPDNMRWVGKHLIEHAEKEETLKPYTMEELHARIDESEREFAEGKCKPIEEVFRRWDMDVNMVAEEEAEYGTI